MPSLPKCGAIVEKSEDVELVCPDDAVDLVSVTNPDNHAQVTAVLLMCAKHSQDFDEGKLLMFKAEDGSAIAVQNSQEENHVPNSSPDADAPARSTPEGGD